MRYDRATEQASKPTNQHAVGSGIILEAAHLVREHIRAEVEEVGTPPELHADAAAGGTASLLVVRVNRAGDYHHQVLMGAGLWWEFVVEACGGGAPSDERDSSF